MRLIHFGYIGMVPKGNGKALRARCWTRHLSISFGAAPTVQLSDDAAKWTAFLQKQA